MTSKSLAELMYPHVERDWDVVAELSTPGLASKLEAVRAGRAKMASVPVKAAVKLAGELTDPHAAVAGETRAAVLQAVGLAPAPKPTVKRRTASEKLFDADPDTVLAALRGRRSISPAIAVAYCSADPAVRDATWELLVERAGSQGGATVLAERCETLGADIAPLIAAMSARHQLLPQYTRRPLVERVWRAACAAIEGWLGAHTVGGAIGYLGYETAPQPLSPAPARGACDGLGALAASLGIAVTGAPELARGALAAAAAGAVSLYSPVAVLAVSAGHPWAAIGAAFNLTANGRANTTALTGIVEALIRAGHDEAAGDAVNDVLGGGGATTYPNTHVHTLGNIFAACGRHLEPGPALRYCAIAATNSTAARRSAVTAMSYLSGSYGPAPDVDHVVAACDPGIREYLDRVADVAPFNGERIDTSADAARIVFDRVFAVRPASSLAALAATAPAADSGWVRHWAAHIEESITAIVGADGAAYAELWSAVMAILDGFDGLTTEAVDVAAAMCGLDMAA